METAIIVGFIMATALSLWAPIVAFSESTRRWVKGLYLCCFVTAVVASFFTTFRYTYYANPNTLIHGWPIPTVVFQRVSPTSPWLDFVGPTIVLAYPMNVLFFILPPSLVVLFLAFFTRRKNKQMSPCQKP